MIKVIIKRKTEKINELTIKGHAKSNIKSSEFDLVCAGVSAVVYGILNSLDQNLIANWIKDGFVFIKVNKYSEYNNIILETLKTSLKTIEEEYEKYISIKEEVL